MNEKNEEKLQLAFSLFKQLPSVFFSGISKRLESQRITTSIIETTDTCEHGKKEDGKVYHEFLDLKLTSSDSCVSTFLFNNRSASALTSKSEKN